MKKLVMFLPVALLFLLAACGNDNGTSAQRQEFQEQTEDQIADFNQQIEDARERAEGLSGDA
ncbi:MAG TPA: hypothetical protein VFA32_10170, partial [Dehalococcoidia bacterium]|nr:hypothetical protein [Dehalococcoidia bacterium]